MPSAIRRGYPKEKAMARKRKKNPPVVDVTKEIDELLTRTEPLRKDLYEHWRKRTSGTLSDTRSATT